VGIAIVALIVIVIVQGQGKQTATEPPGKTIAGIACDRGMTPGYHVHTHLDIYEGNKLHPIPPFVGFNLSHDCLYWLHTHQYQSTPQSMDMIHLESPTKVTPTLGTFFRIWGQPLSRHEVYNIKLKKGQSMRVTVDGKLYTGNPRDIPIKSHQNVTIAVGPPFHKPTPFNFDAYDKAHPGNGF